MHRELSTRWPAICGLALFLALTAAPANAQRYCVRDVEVVDAAHSPSLLPTAWMLPEGAAFPILRRTVLTTEEGRRTGRTLLWRFSPDRPRIAPVDTGYSFDFDSEERRIATARDGRMLMSGGRSGSDGRLFWRDRQGEMSPLPDELQARLGRVSAIFRSDLLGGHVVTSTLYPASDAPEARVRRGRGQTAILNDDTLTLLPLPRQPEGVVDLPSSGVVALTGGRALHLLDPATRAASPAFPLDTGEFGPHRRALETADPGWIYLPGIDHDHAVRIERGAEGWRAAEAVRIVREQGVLDRLWPGLDSRWPLTRVIGGGACRRFSPALGRVVLCSSPMSVLREGRAAPLGGDVVRYVGDSRRLGAAIFQRRDYGLVAHDGREARSVEGPVGPGASPMIVVADPAQADSTVLLTRERLLEVVPAGAGLQVVERMRFDDPRHAAMVVAERNGPLLVFDARDVTVVSASASSHVWRAPEGRRVMQANLRPVAVPGWSGVLFATGANAAGLEPAGLHLLAPCAPG